MVEHFGQWWREGAFARRRPFLIKRAAINRALRAWFDAADFVEVETAALQVSPGLEPHLNAFATDLVAPDGQASRLYLHTSPEYAMKKLLVAGEPRIFQLARVWRNGERSATHHPEFTMLEWYRAGEPYTRLMEDCAGLVQAALTATGEPVLRWRGLESDPFQPWQMLTVAEAFDRYCGIDLAGTIDDPDSPGPAALAAEAARLGIRTAADDDWDAIFFRLFLERIEPNLGHPVPTILCEYPIHMAALSRPKDGDPRVAERFELYVAGLELANAFGELTDAAEQRRRFETDRALRTRLFGAAYPIDEDFLDALGHGMPAASGIAMGIDRLAMLATGASRIDDVLWAPVAPIGT